MEDNLVLVPQSPHTASLPSCGNLDQYATALDILPEVVQRSTCDHCPLCERVAFHEPSLEGRISDLLVSCKSADVTLRRGRHMTDKL